MLIMRVVAFVAILFSNLFISRARGAGCCPFCVATGQTLRQEIDGMDVVGIVTLANSPLNQQGSLARFKFEKIIKGEALVEPGFEPQASYIGPADNPGRYLLMGVNPDNFTWSAPIVISKAAEDYVQRILELPQNPLDRLAFFQNYFEHEDLLLSRDVYDEFAQASYEEIIKFGPKMNREKYIEFANDPAISPNRKRLYYTLIGVCGKPEDIDWLEKKLRSKEPQDRVGLDALSAAYLNLKGEAGLSLIVDVFLKDHEREYAEIYAIAGALRFHATEGKKIETTKIADAMATLLDRPEYADLIIADLARLDNWMHLEKIMNLFREAKQPDAWLLRAPIVNYMMACPLPKAKEYIIEMEKLDPHSFHRAKTNFPIPRSPKPAADPTKKSTRKWEKKQQLSSSVIANRSDEPNGLGLGYRKDLRVAYLDSMARQESIQFSATVTPPMKTEVNPFACLSVILLGTTTLGLCMWFVGTGGLR